MGSGEAYVLLGLRLGRHVDGLVDSYCGPEELREQVDAEPLTDPGTLVEQGDALLAENSRTAGCATRRYGLRTYAGVLAGEGLSYSDEVERCYGAPAEACRPGRLPRPSTSSSTQLLPGSGDLAKRYETWRTANRVPPQTVVPVIRDLVACCASRPPRSSSCRTVRVSSSRKFTTSRGGR